MEFYGISIWYEEYRWQHQPNIYTTFDKACDALVKEINYPKATDLINREEIKKNLEASESKRAVFHSYGKHDLYVYWAITKLTVVE